MNIDFILNGNRQKVSITSVERALDVLVRQCNIKSLPGTCLEGQCGGCLILVDKRPAYSCLMPAFILRDRSIETIEFFLKSREYNLLYAELTKEGKTLCSSCQNAVMLMGMTLIHRTLSPSREEILMALANVHCDSIFPDDFADAVLATIQLMSTVRKVP